MIALFLLSRNAAAFAPIAPSARRRLTTPLGASSREEEIAKLEEQLRKLREEQQEESTSNDGDDDDDKYQMYKREISQVESRILEKVKGKDMILSERDLYDGNIMEEEDQSAQSSNIVPNILAAVAALVFLGIFSQIPIGQEDLSKYSVSPTTSTSRTIDLGDLNTDAPRP